MLITNSFFVHCLQVGTIKAEYVAKLQAAESRVREIESARDEAKKQAAALAKEVESSKTSVKQVCAWAVLCVRQAIVTM